MLGRNVSSLCYGNNKTYQTICKQIKIQVRLLKQTFHRWVSGHRMDDEVVQNPIRQEQTICWGGYILHTAVNAVK